MNKLVEYFAQKSLLVNVISLAVLIAGVIFLFTANREAFPKVEYDWVVVTTIYPGATPDDVEKHISIPIEDELREVDGIEEVIALSVESSSVVSIQIEADSPDKAKIKNDIRNAIDLVKDLPDEAEDPIVQELNSSLYPVIEVSLFAKKGVNSDAEERDLREKADILEDRFLELNEVAKIQKGGYREREMKVEVDPLKLIKYHVAMNDIITALSKKNLNFPGGISKTKKGDIMLRTIGEVENAKDIRNVLIRANDQGNWVKISDVAKVWDTFEEEKITNKVNSEKAITLTPLKKERADIITLVDKLFKEIDIFKKQYSEKYEITTSNDFSYYVKRRLNVLVNNGKVGIILVFLSLFITLGWRISLVTALGIPLAFCGTFIWMGYAGITINLMSMFGLIIVLGLLVDDAIVVAENIYRHLEEGLPVKEAVITGATEVVVPVAGTIMTTIAAFSPLMFMSGIIGKFIWSLPAVVTIALAASWLESMFILPSHILDIEKRKSFSKEDKKNKIKIFAKIIEGYKRVLFFVLRHKYKFVFLITVVFLGSVVFSKFNLKFVLFPSGKVERFVVKVEAETGTSILKMSRRMEVLEKIIASLPEEELDNYITRVGIIEEEPMDPHSKEGSNYGTIFVNLTAEEERERKADAIIDYLRKEGEKVKNHFTKLEFKYIENGPPVGDAISVSIKGNNFDVLEEIAEKFKNFLGTIEGIKDIQDNYEEGKVEKRIYVNEKLAAITGVSVFDVATTIRSCFEGNVATKIKKTDEEIDIRVIFPEKYRNDLKSLDLIKVSNKQGNLIPLSEIAKFKSAVGKSKIIRKNWKRSINVTADIDENAKKVTSVYVNGLLIDNFKNITEEYPDVIIDYEGEFKDSEESVRNLSISFSIAIMVIYIILIALFSSWWQPLVIMGIIPLASIGVIWTFFFHNMPLSFLALMGIVGLAGVIVNDSIVFVDFINKKIKEGLPPLEASIEAGGNRIRAIFLTTITTFFGLIPTAYGLGGFDPFLKPMAVAMAWGIAFGTVITLFCTPLLYNIFTDVKSLFRKG